MSKIPDRGRLPFLVANWKMHKIMREARVFFEDLLKLLPEKIDREVVICPPFTLLYAAASFADGRFGIGAQDIFWETHGPYTGEVSGAMLKDAGCSYVLIAHSERRRYFGETDSTANRKVLAAIEQGLKPVLCVGETLAEMEKGLTNEIVGEQIREGLKNLRQDDFGKLTLAYEPVWAIGTGKADSPEQSNKTIRFIRDTLSGITGHLESQKTRILYGGSVNPQNIDAFMSQPEIDGALVGGASLNPESFSRIVLYQTALKA